LGKDAMSSFPLSPLFVGGWDEGDDPDIHCKSTGLRQRAVLRHQRRPDATPPVDPECCRSIGDLTIRLHLVSFPSAAWLPVRQRVEF